MSILRAWRAACPELRAMWDESTPVAQWAGVTLGGALQLDPQVDPRLTLLAFND